MSDEGLRELQRRWSASQDPEDELALLRERVRLGLSSERHLEAIPWLRRLIDAPPLPKLLEPARERLSTHESFVLGYELATRARPGFSLPQDLEAFRASGSAPPPRLRHAPDAPGFRVQHDLIPDLLRSIATPPPPGLLSKAMTLIPGIRGFRSFPLATLWQHLLWWPSVTDHDRVWRTSLRCLLETICSSAIE